MRIVLPNNKLDVLSPEQSAIFEETKVRFAPFSGFMLLYEGEDLENVKKDLEDGISIERYRQGKLGEVNQEHFEMLQAGDKILEEGQTKTT